MMSMTLTSPAFRAGTNIPPAYTCDGDDVSPPLAWSQVPPQAQSLALIIEDPDAPDPQAPQRVWVHWLLFNIPPTSLGLPPAIRKPDFAPQMREGVNDWHRVGYGGPCPPVGRHRYVHKLYALDQMLPLIERASRAQLEEAMRGHILEQAELIGLYQRK
ncbi:MAG: YbhB/YbcL family Raf kinase inhibitor-like protein [Pseudomonadota bacterium]